MTKKAHLQPIISAHAPVPNGHYSQAMQSGGIVFLSVQLPMMAGQNIEPSAMDPLTQAKQVLANIEHIVTATGGTKNDVARLTFYITSQEFWPIINQACEEFFGEHKPARGVLHVQSLSKGYSIAADGIAVVAPL